MRAPSENGLALADFIDYAMAKPEVRFITYSDFVRWMQVGGAGLGRRVAARLSRLRAEAVAGGGWWWRWSRQRMQHVAAAGGLL